VGGKGYSYDRRQGVKYAYERLAGCTGKARWLSFGLADRQAKKMRRRGKGRFTAYYCPSCKGFHVGSSTKWETIE